MRLRSALPVLVLLCSVLFPSAAVAQALDGTWFKVTLNVRGGALDGSELSKAKGKVVAYVLVNAAPPVEGGSGIALINYIGDVYSETSSGNWSEVSTLFFATIGDDESGFVGPTAGANDAGAELVVALPSDGSEGLSDFLSVHFTGRLKLKMDKEGALKKASFKSFGAVIQEGYEGDVYLFGGAKVSGKSIDPSKLPFTPS